MRSGRMIVDSHSHLLPEEIRSIASFYSEDWGQIEKQIATMDELGIDKSVLSYPTTDVVTRGRLTISQEASIYNEAMGKIARRYPDRFLWTSLTPVGDPGAKDEVKKAKEELGAGGISLASSYDGVYLDDQRFYSIYECAVALKLPIFVHATTSRPIGSERVVDPLLTPVIEFLFDLTMCIGKLMMSGTLAEFPDLTLVVAHYGGVLPFLRERFDVTYDMLRKIGYVKDLTAPPSTHLKRIYVDVSGTTSPATVKCALELFGAERILWGSDYPSNKKVAESLACIEELEIGESEKSAILGANSEGVMA